LVSVNGTKTQWAGDLTVEESRQIRFAVNRLTEGKIEAEDGENLFAELSLFRDAVQRQLTEIEKLRVSEAANLNVEAEWQQKVTDLEIALANQKEVIDRLRGQVADGFHKETIESDSPEFHNETDEEPNLPEFHNETSDTEPPVSLGEN
jgi:hypothetical protein